MREGRVRKEGRKEGEGGEERGKKDRTRKEGVRG